MADTLVLDTNAFNERGLLHHLAGRRERKLLPAVAAAEFYYHIVTRRAWSPGRFFDALRLAGIVIEPLDAHKALAAVDAAGKEFPLRPADALIGAHALSPGRILVTRNLAHFPQVPRKVTPAELLRGDAPR